MVLLYGASIEVKARVYILGAWGAHCARISPVWMTCPRCKLAGLSLSRPLSDFPDVELVKVVLRAAGNFLRQLA